MSRWAINPQQLKYKLTEVMGAEPAQLAEPAHQPAEPDKMTLKLALRIADRISREKGEPGVVSRKELYLAADAALDALKAGGFHYLNGGDRKTTASTLLALERLSWPGSSRWLRHRRVIEPASAMGGLERWDAFLSRFAVQRQSGWDRFVAGVREFIGARLETGRDFLMGGAALLVDPGESIDIRFNTLMQRAMLVVDGVVEPSDEKWQEAHNDYGLRGLREPLTREELAETKKRLQSKLETGPTDRQWVDFLRSDRDIRNDVINLFNYISAFGKPNVARHADEVLVVLDSGIYLRRADAPIGRPSPAFPEINGRKSEEVIPFLRDKLKIPITPENERGVWRQWQRAWKQKGVKATDVLMDLDKTSFDYRLSVLSGVEEVQIRDVVISLVALALRDETPVSFCSHTIRARITDIANHPLLAALRFAYFLRMPDDPDITLEEVEGMYAIANFEHLAHGEIAYLEKFIVAGLPFDELDSEKLLPHSRRIIFRALLQRGLEFIRGPKDQSVIEKGGKGPRGSILVDDSSRNLNAHIESRGKGGVLVPKRGELDLANVFRKSKFLPSIFEAVELIARRSQEEEPVVIQARAAILPGLKATVVHQDWWRKIYYGWVKPSVQLSLLRLKIWWHLIWKGPKFVRDFLKTARNFLNLGFDDHYSNIADSDSADRGDETTADGQTTGAQPSDPATAEGSNLDIVQVTAVPGVDKQNGGGGGTLAGVLLLAGALSMAGDNAIDVGAQFVAPIEPVANDDGDLVEPDGEVEDEVDLDTEGGVLGIAGADVTGRSGIFATGMVNPVIQSGGLRAATPVLARVPFVP